MRAFVLLSVLLVALPAAAADKAKARELYRVGTQHYNLAEYDKALDSFKEAYRHLEDPIFLFNIGQCERQLDHKTEAVRFYRAYLRTAPTASNRGEVSALIAKLESAIAEENAAKHMPPVAPSEGTLQSPPATTSAPAATSPPAATPALTTTPTQPEPSAHASTPLYKRWWLWTIVGAVAAGTAVGVGVGLAERTPAAPTSPTELGNYRF